MTFGILQRTTGTNKSIKTANECKRMDRMQIWPRKIKVMYHKIFVRLPLRSLLSCSMFNVFLSILFLFVYLLSITFNPGVGVSSSTAHAGFVAGRLLEGLQQPSGEREITSVTVWFSPSIMLATVQVKYS